MRGSGVKGFLLGITNETHFHPPARNASYALNRNVHCKEEDDSSVITSRIKNRCYPRNWPFWIIVNVPRYTSFG